MIEVACIAAGFMAAIGVGHLITAQYLLDSGNPVASVLAGIAVSFFACCGWSFVLAYLYRPR